MDFRFTYEEVTRTCQPLLSAMNFETGLEMGYTIYTNESCTNELEDRTVEYEENKYYGMLLNFEEKELTGEELPDSARKAGAGDAWGFAGPATQYNLGLTLSNKEKPTTTPTAGDTLGTITISIRAAE